MALTSPKPTGTKMGIFDIFKKKEEPKVDAEPKAPKPKAPAKKTAKEIATEKGEPWVSVVAVELDPDNIGNGAFELDWNDKFITNLVRAGFKGKDDAAMVDQWFQDVCRNVVMENFEQWEANQPTELRPRVVDKQDLGNGKTVVS
jgi:hypothetical protein